MEAIEGDKKYFTNVFYREHAVINNDDYVKDISRIGRDLSKMIIVDNMPQNFRLQKENGILIIFEDIILDPIYTDSLEILNNMDQAIDMLFERSKKIRGY